MDIIKEKSRCLEETGFVTFAGFTNDELIKQAHTDLLAWLAKDKQERLTNNINDAHYDSSAGHTVLTKPSHLMIDVYGKSPALDQIVEKIFTDPVTSAVLKNLVGDSFDLYGYNIRLMSGTYDPGPAHEWHRDSPGEFGIGILLTDVPPEENAATALVPGSHYFPYCPRWNTLFKDSCRDYHAYGIVIKTIINLLPFNRLLQKRIRKIASGASGKRGDVYFFINDVWHGRDPNLHGQQTMVMLIGGAPTDFKLHHAITQLPEETINNLPSHVREAFCNRNKPVNTNKDTILHRVISKQQKLQPFSLFYWARLERKLFDCFVNLTKRLLQIGRKYKNSLKKFMKPSNAS